MVVGVPKQNLLLVLALVSSSQLVSATTRGRDYDYDVVCLDLETGKQVWRVNPGRLGAPEFRVVGERLIARGSKRYAMSLKSGASVPLPRKGWASAPKNDISIRPNLVDARGHRFRTGCWLCPDERPEACLRVFLVCAPGMGIVLRVQVPS